MVARQKKKKAAPVTQRRSSHHQGGGVNAAAAATDTPELQMVCVVPPSIYNGLLIDLLTRLDLLPHHSLPPLRCMHNLILRPCQILKFQTTA